MSDIKNTLDRRDFLKTLAITAGSTALATNCSTVDKTKSKVRYAMLIDLRRCYGCHACSVSCKAQFNVPLGVWRSWVKTAERGQYPNTRMFFLPVLCNHCENPPCVPVCPTGATYQRTDGIVVVNEEKCIGCKYCIQNCPYESRFSHPEKKVANKCDFCIDRVEKGLVPSCVNTCPSNARVFGNINDPNSEISKLIARNPVRVLKKEMGTEPRVFYIGLDDDSGFEKKVI